MMAYPSTWTSTTSTGSSSSHMLYIQTSTASSTTVTGNVWYDVDDSDGWVGKAIAEAPLKELVRGRTYTLPDKSEIEIDADGNWKVVKQGAIQYRAANIRNFNRFLNASDLLEDFIRDCGKLGVRQGEFLKIPVEAFINWLIFRAAEADGEESPVPMLPASKPVVDRCLYCKRFLAVRLIVAGVNFCNGLHLTKFGERERLALP